MSCLRNPLQKILLRLLSRLDKVAAKQPGRGQVIYVTSASDGEGKTFMATALAKQATVVSAGRILLIDASIEAPKLHEYFSSNNDVGLSEILSGQDWDDKLCQETKIPNLYILPVGRKHRSGLLFMQDVVSEFLNQVRNHFDLIIIDAASITSSGANSMGGLVDGILLVIDTTSTRREVFEHAIRELKEDQGKIVGAVLNKKKHYIPSSLYRRL